MSFQDRGKACVSFTDLLPKKIIKVCIVLVMKLIVYKAGVILCIGDEMSFQYTRGYP